MKKTRVALNGFGRIGRITARIMLKTKSLELAAINSRADSQSHAYLLRHDSTYGDYDLEVKSDRNHILVGNRKISVFNYSRPSEIPWYKGRIDIVVDTSGQFLTEADLKGHLNQGAKYVILSAPAKDDMKTLVLGVNEETFVPRTDLIVSNSSCTTNCLAATVKVLETNFKIKRAFMTTTHAVTDSQNLLDNSHKSVRLRRSAVTSVIPASTGSARDIVKLFPSLKNNIVCRALRVPVTTVSLINLVAEVAESTSVNLVNQAFESASNTYLKNIISASKEQLVSADYKASPYSAVVDTYLTDVIGGNLLNIYAWYDNEWGYCQRLMDLCQFISERI